VIQRRRSKATELESCREVCSGKVLRSMFSRKPTIVKGTRGVESEKRPKHNHLGRAGAGMDRKRDLGEIKLRRPRFYLEAENSVE
jgi:hypothetical protein